ncbi:putative motility protein [Paenibacillus sp. 1011MAR3C5]|uniref:YjfB family protein n=1 Tax=Paenibacillus sp. 1011MAR3C5 TaxID=1675787 RepID=UPI000E6B5516|nr:YjfB family protein [Paenibacillus sp. 1011MAR3C5]RJE90168.1 putative motility protein [Paenibacillus sp. 1011MAR3C5]
MDIGALSIALSQSRLAQSVGIKMLSIAKGQAEQQGQQLTDMIGKSLDPNLGQTLDLRA